MIGLRYFRREVNAVFLALAVAAAATTWYCHQEANRALRDRCGAGVAVERTWQPKPSSLVVRRAR